MSDELKNKNGKVKVMYVRSDDDSDKRTQNPRTGKGGGRPVLPEPKAVVALPVMTERVRTANVAVNGVVTAMLNATVNVKIHRGVPCLARRAMT